MQKKLVLCILDGWGIRPETQDNGLVVAKHWQQFLQKYPNTVIQASEEYVGLPHGQMGNSEVGHMTIGLGRLMEQDLPRINRAIKENSFEKLPLVQKLIQTLKGSGKACHVMGLLSPGGVHSHQDHLVAVVGLLTKHSIPVFIHAFLDGRDTPPKSALDSIKFLMSHLGPTVKIATIGGRYFGMDRDKRWDRIEKAYNAMVEGKTEHCFKDANLAVQHFYDQNITDEFIPHSVIDGYSGMQDGDGIWMVNFRSDRARQILTALLDPSFNAFKPCKEIQFSVAVGMSEYSDELSPFIPPIFEKIPLSNGLGEFISAQNQKQLRVAETEKYAHVTFFFNGGREEPFKGEDRILVPSPNVATYDLKPEMSAVEVKEGVINAMHSKKHQLIVVNFANTDMVGHTGVPEAIKKAVQTVDECLFDIEQAAFKYDWTVVITADHGNAELMVDSHGDVHTAHTCNPVPFMIINGPKGNLKNFGTLADVAPTVLNLLGYKQPSEMTGASLWS